MHGVREGLMDRQALSIGIPLKKVFLPEEAGMESYDATMHETLRELSGEGIHTSLFGDIFLEDLRDYRERALAKVGWECAFPLWERPTKDLLLDFIRAGFRAVLVCVDDACLDASLCGQNV